MSRAPHDKELVEYRHEIGNEEYAKQYSLLYLKARNNKGRYSGLTYENSKERLEERLEEIRNKYKNGVTKEILNEFMEKI